MSSAFYFLLSHFANITIVFAKCNLGTYILLYILIKLSIDILKISDNVEHFCYMHFDILNKFNDLEPIFTLIWGFLYKILINFSIFILIIFVKV